jgi:integrase
MAKLTKKGRAKPAWNKDRAIGQKRAFTPAEISEIATLLKREGKTKPLARRDLALLRVAVDSMLRAGDLLALTIGDVWRGQEAVAEFDVRQQKTGAGVTCDLSEETREAIASWIAVGWQDEPEPDDLVFQIETRRHYSRIVKGFAEMIRLDPAKYSTHSLRRSKAKEVFRQTKNLEVVRQLLGQKSLGATSHYLGIEKEDARAVGRSVKI